MSQASCAVHHVLFDWFVSKGLISFFVFCPYTNFSTSVKHKSLLLICLENVCLHYAVCVGIVLELEHKGFDPVPIGSAIKMVL